MLRGWKEGFLTTFRHNNNMVYERALGSLVNNTNVLLESSVVAMARDLAGNFAHAVVSTAYDHKLLRVKQFLFTLAPKLDNLAGLDLNEQEQCFFLNSKATIITPAYFEMRLLPQTPSFLTWW